MKKRKIYLGLLVTLAFALSAMLSLPVMAQTANSLSQILSVDPTVTYPDGTLQYTVSLTNLNVAGAQNCTANITFYPPGPDGLVDYASPVILDTNKFIAVGQTITYNSTGGGGAIARSGLAVDLGAIPLDPGVSVVYGASAFQAEYIHVPAYSNDDLRNAPALVINPDISIEKTVEFDGDSVYTDLEYNDPGAPASWNITVCNTGDDPVYNITVWDTNSHNFGAVFNLTVGECKEFIYTTTNVTDNIINTAHAQGVDELGNQVGPVQDAAEVRVNRPPPVGGTAFLVDKAGLLAPWIALLGCAAVVTLLVLRRRRHA